MRERCSVAMRQSPRPSGFGHYVVESIFALVSGVAFVWGAVVELAEDYRFFKHNSGRARAAHGQRRLACRVLPAALRCAAGSQRMRAPDPYRSLRR